MLGWITVICAGFVVRLVFGYNLLQRTWNLELILLESLVILGRSMSRVVSFVGQRDGEDIASTSVKFSLVKDRGRRGSREK